MRASPVRFQFAGLVVLAYDPREDMGMNLVLVEGLQVLDEGAWVERLQGQTFDDIRPVIRPGGRTGAGAQNHCAHGKNIVLEKIVDWRPFEHYTTELPFGFSSQHFEPLSNGTRLNSYFKLKMPLPHWLSRLVSMFMSKMLKLDEQYNTLVWLIEEEANK